MKETLFQPRAQTPINESIFTQKKLTNEDISILENSLRVKIIKTQKSIDIYGLELEDIKQCSDSINTILKQDHFIRKKPSISLQEMKILSQQRWEHLSQEILLVLGKNGVLFIPENMEQMYIEGDIHAVNQIDKHIKRKIEEEINLLQPKPAALEISQAIQKSRKIKVKVEEEGIIILDECEPVLLSGREEVLNKLSKKVQIWNEELSQKQARIISLGEDMSVDIAGFFKKVCQFHNCRFKTIDSRHVELKGDVPQHLLSCLRQGNFILQFPQKWQQMEEGQQYKQVLVLPGTNQFEQVKNRFLRDEKRLIVERIFRLQNKQTLYSTFIKRNEQKQKPRILKAYHGSRENTPDTVWKELGKANAFQNGIIISPLAKYGIRYSHQSVIKENQRCVIQLIVLQQDAKLVKDFPKRAEKGKIMYTKENGRAFKVFDSSIIQPNYLIYFSRKNKKSFFKNEPSEQTLR